MKKIFIVMIIVIYCFVSNRIIDSLTIPKDSLRIRIIPNSNSNFDQGIKNNIKDKLEITMYDLLRDASSREEAKEIIVNNLDLVDRDVKNVLEE